MKKKLLIMSIIVLIVITILAVILIKTKEGQNNTIGEDRLEEIHKNNVNGLDLVIEGMPTEIIEKINDKQKFEQELKEYAYENNIVDYGKIYFKFIEQKQSGNILTLKMQAEDLYRTKIIVDIKLNENTYEFYSYK